jgi:hypothetical protein
MQKVGVTVWEMVSRMEAESATAQASARGEAEGFPPRITLMESKLAEAR